MDDPMKLNPHVNYPSARTYVLKLHHDAMPGHGRIFGRLENLSSSHHFDFSSGDDLLARLAQDALPLEPDPQAADQRGPGDANSAAI